MQKVLKVHGLSWSGYLAVTQTNRNGTVTGYVVDLIGVPKLDYGYRIWACVDKRNTQPEAMFVEYRQKVETRNGFKTILRKEFSKC